MARKKIMVVDDDASVRRALCRALLGAGYDVALAEDGAEAAARFDGSIDLLLLDIGLPNQSGWETFRRIHAGNPGLPIVIITGQAGGRKAAQSAGASGFLEKPLDPPLLLQTVEEILGESNAPQAQSAGGFAAAGWHNAAAQDHRVA